MSRGAGSPRRFAGPSALLLALALATSASSAHADTASEAQLQYELGSELYKQGRYIEAIERFIASNRLAPNPNVVLNVAQTYAFLRRPAEAYNWYSTYLAFELTPEQRSAAEGARAALLPEVAVLDVTTDPPRAELFVDRLELGSVGVSPRQIAVDAGNHRLVARVAGYHDADVMVPAERGHARPIQLTLAAIVGQLSLASQPAGVHIRSETGGAELGVTPTKLELPVGEHRLVFSAPGYVDQSRVIVVREGQNPDLSVKLSREASTVSVLSISGNPAGARVLLDGVEVGRSPFSYPDVSPGSRALNISAAGYEPWQGRVAFEPGAATRIDFKLQDPKERAWRGWRYVGYGSGGALLIAGGIVGALALQAKSDFDHEPSKDGLDKLHALNTTSDVLWISGAVIAATTLVLQLVTPEKRSKATVTFSR